MHYTAPNFKLRPSVHAVPINITDLLDKLMTLYKVMQVLLTAQVQLLAKSMFLDFSASIEIHPE